MAATARHFDTLRAAEELEAAGLPHDQAKAISLVVNHSRESSSYEDRFEKLEGDLAALDSKVEKLDGKVEKLEGDLAALDSKVEKLDNKVERLDGKMEKQIAELENRLTKWTIAVGAIVIAAVSLITKL